MADLTGTLKAVKNDGSEDEENSPKAENKQNIPEITVLCLPTPKTSQLRAEPEE